jgi:tocopherol O-methyltransferase
MNSREPASPARVARHYDELDRWYRLLWGEHLHHGWWRTGRETVEEATEALVEEVARRAELTEGARVVDLGSGYGATARLLARRWRCRVTAVTLSPVQHARAEAAEAAEPVSPAPEYRLGDFTRIALPGKAFDAVVAIESLSHVEELDTAAAEAARVLRPSGRLVACVWLGGERVGALRRRLLSDPVVAEGRLARLAPAAVYTEALTRAGFAVEEVEDVSARVRRTWWICLRRTAARLVRDAEARRVVAAGGEGVFAWTVPRLLAAYWVGALRYGIFTARLAR